MPQSAATESSLATSDDWLERARARCRKALRDASAAPDRLALLRELARLSDGYLDLDCAGIRLTGEELSRSSEFGLEVQEPLLRIVEFHKLPEAVAECFKLDSAPRRRSRPGTPDAVLLRWTNHKSYRTETQKAAVRALQTMPRGASLMVSMPTGSGKSLLFQLAPFVWSAGEAQPCVVVITPTIALADDHERTLRSFKGLESSRALTSRLSRQEREEVLFSFRRGEIPVLLMSPEQAFGAAREALIEAAQSPDQKHGLQARLTAFVVDEAHIVESWGRSFRPDFQRLPSLVAELRERNPDLRTVLLSATIGRTAQAELRRAYSTAAWLEIHAGVPRYEFDLAALRYDSKESRDAALMSVIYAAPRPAIIYTTQVEDAARLFAELTNDKGFKRIALFTGEVSDGQTRQAIVDQWAQDKLDLVVATSAFGMGVDKADVRTVVHACLPESPSRFYQEIGRAARDGHQGHGVCLWFASSDEEDDDERLALRMASGSWITREKAEKRWRAILDWGRAHGGLTWHGLRRRMTVNLDAVREGLNSDTSDYNRNWNMSVLNFLQRAGALEIAGVQDPSNVPTWTVDILRDELTKNGTEYEELWDAVEEVRENEQNAAVRDFRVYKRLLTTDGSACVLGGVFELVDDHGSLAPDCGRCWVCRRRGIRPPTAVKSGGLRELWAERLPLQAWQASSVTMVIPTDDEFQSGLACLITTLVSAGVEQFVTPDRLASETAEILAGSACQIGLVLSHSDWMHEGWALSKLPTAVLLDRTSRIGDAWRIIAESVEADQDQAFVLVGASDLRVGGRPLQQIASNQAPFTQESFANFVQERSAS